MNKPKKESVNKQIYLTIYRTLKKLLTFKIQKAVRKIKNGNKVGESGDVDEEAKRKVENIEKEKKSGLNQKIKLDTITKENLKVLTLYMMTTMHDITLDHDREFFEKELPEFEKKLEGYLEEEDTSLANLKWFLTSVTTHRQYKELQEKLAFMLQRASKFKEKRDKKIQSKREREKVKRQLEKSKKLADLEDMGAVTEKQPEKKVEREENLYMPLHPEKANRPHFKDRAQRKQDMQNQKNFRGGNQNFRDRGDNKGFERKGFSRDSDRGNFQRTRDSDPEKKFHHDGNMRPPKNDDNGFHGRHSYSRNQENTDRGGSSNFRSRDGGQSRDYKRQDNNDRNGGRNFDRDRGFEKRDFSQGDRDQGRRYNNDRPSYGRPDSRGDSRPGGNREDLHPSWKFKKEEKNAVFIAPFLGTKVKL